LRHATTTPPAGLTALPAADKSRTTPRHLAQGADPAASKRQEIDMPTRKLLLTLALVAFNSHAATVIEVKTPEGQTKVYRDGARSRVDAGDGSYMLVDSKAGTLRMVVPAQRQVMDMSQMLKTPPPANGAPVDVTLQKLGNGQVIAGYPTTRYHYLANGTDCGTVLASEQALEDSDLHETFEVMERMAARADAIMTTFNEHVLPCQRAGTRFSDYAKKIGVPMRVTGPGGELLSEIVRIDKNAKLSPDTFSIPAGYQVRNTGQLLQQLPDIGEMMKQMQQQMQQ